MLNGYYEEGLRLCIYLDAINILFGLVLISLEI